MNISRKELSGWLQVGVGVICLQLAFGWLVGFGAWMLASGLVMLLRPEVVREAEKPWHEAG